MIEQLKKRYASLQAQLRENGISMAILSDESSIAYFAGFWGYLGIEFGRPTFLIVRADDDPVVITPLMESEMVFAMTWVQDVRTWEDIGPRSWGAVLSETLGTAPTHIWFETLLLPAIVRVFRLHRMTNGMTKQVKHILQKCGA